MAVLKSKFIHFGLVLIAWCCLGCNKEFLRRNALQSHTQEFERTSLSAASHLDPDVTMRLRSSESFISSQSEIADNLKAAEREANAGRLDQAARFYERVLRDDKDHAVAHQRLALIAKELDQSTNDERNYKKGETPFFADSELLPDRKRLLGDEGAVRQVSIEQSVAIAPRLAFAERVATSDHPLEIEDSPHRLHEPAAISRTRIPAIISTHHSKTNDLGSAVTNGGVRANFRQEVVAEDVVKNRHHLVSKALTPEATLHQNLRPYRRSMKSDSDSKGGLPVGTLPGTDGPGEESYKSKEAVNVPPTRIDLPLWLPE